MGKSIKLSGEVYLDYSSIAQKEDTGIVRYLDSDVSSIKARIKGIRHKKYVAKHFTLDGTNGQRFDLEDLEFNPEAEPYGDELYYIWQVNEVIQASILLTSSGTKYPMPYVYKTGSTWHYINYSLRVDAETKKPYIQIGTDDPSWTGYTLRMVFGIVSDDFKPQTTEVNSNA